MDINKKFIELYEEYEKEEPLVDVQPAQDSTYPPEPSSEDAKTEDKNIEEPFSQDDLPF